MIQGWFHLKQQNFFLNVLEKLILAVPRGSPRFQCSHEFRACFHSDELHRLLILKQDHTGFYEIILIDKNKNVNVQTGIL
jgi:hypothetical protein